MQTQKKFILTVQKAGCRLVAGRQWSQQLEEKLSKKNEVLGELMEEYVELKKELGAL